MPSFGSVFTSITQNITTRLSNQLARARGFFGEPAQHLEDYDAQEAMEALDERARGQLQQQIDALQAGKVDHGSFYENTTRILRRLYMGAAIVGAGGLANTTQSVIDRIQDFTSKSFDLLFNFTDQMVEKQSVEQSDMNRLQSYVDSSYAAAESARRNVVAASQTPTQITEERRILTPGDSCATCIEEAGKGWVPVGTLKPIGQSECGRRCRCNFEYRTVDAGQSGTNVNIEDDDA